MIIKSARSGVHLAESLLDGRNFVSGICKLKKPIKKTLKTWESGVDASKREGSQTQQHSAICVGFTFKNGTTSESILWTTSAGLVLCKQKHVVL